jgi:Domain of unknown function (DUF4252)
MKSTCVDVTRCTNRRLGLVAAVACVIFASNALSTHANETVPDGHLDFEAAKLPSANLEVDLSQDTFRSLFGISDAAIAGVAETLFKSVDGEKDTNKKLSAEQLDAVRKIVELSGKFVREVRVRAYENRPEGTDDAGSLLKLFDGQLKVGKWETVVRMRSDDDMLRVAVLHKDGSIRGIFVAAAAEDEIAIANIVCDISPDKVKPLTAAIAKIGMSVDFQPVITWTSSLTSGDTVTHNGIALQTATSTSPSAATVPAAAPKAAAKAVPNPAANAAPKTAAKAAAPAAVTK